MKVEHYRWNTKDGQRWRWRIVDGDGQLVAQGMRIHKFMDQSKDDLGEVIEFLDALMQERMRRALGGE
jgi:hypothetical protein